MSISPNLIRCLLDTGGQGRLTETRMVINNANDVLLKNEAEKGSKAMLWTGRITWALAVPFMFFDVALHLANPPFVQEASQQSGLNPSMVPVIGVIALVAMVLYVIRRTAILGAVLMTGYLGGAVCAHMIMGNFGWFAILIGALLWTSLYCRDARVRTLI